MKLTIQVDKIRSYQTLVYKNGHRTYRKKEYTQYSTSIKKQIDAWETYTDNIQVRIDFYSHTKTIGDLDNIAKPILDILQEVGIINNDKNITTLILTKNYGVTQSRIEITIN